MKKTNNSVEKLKSSITTAQGHLNRITEIIAKDLDGLIPFSVLATTLDRIIQRMPQQ